MRQKTVASAVVVLLLGLVLLWPVDASAQARARRRSVVRAAPAVRVVHARRPVYSRAYYGPYWSYWGWGAAWYPYPYFSGPYGYGYPYWYGYGPWGYRYYSYDNYAAVRVQASPREAHVYVDGYFVGRVDDFDGVFQRLRLPPGGHEITLHLTGYRNVAQQIYLQPGTTFHFKAQLEPLAVGAPPDPPPVPNPAAVKSEEYERREPAGPPSQGWPPREQAEARQPARESRLGTLMIRVQPPDADVIVDGTPWRGAADEDGAIEIQLPAGRHRVEIAREGFVSFTTELDVRAGAATPLNVMLEREDR